MIELNKKQIYRWLTSPKLLINGSASALVILSSVLALPSAAGAAGAAAALWRQLDSRREDPKIAELERIYADFLDAHGAVEAIDAGTQLKVEGRERTTWLHRQDTLRDIFDRKYKEILDKTNLNSSDRRLLDSMRRTFEELTEAGSDSTSISAGCADAPGTSEGSALSAALYACFDSPGNQLRFDDQTLTRVATLQLLQELDDPRKRHELFMAMSPLWRAVNAANEPDSPYRRLIGQRSAAYTAGRSPVHEAAAAFGISAAEAEQWLVRILEAWRSVTVDDGRIEPWDYRYHYSAASRALAGAIPREQLLPLQQRFFADLGADPAALGVLFDIDPRPGKAPLAYSDIVRMGRLVDGRWRPAIARVSANDDRGGLGILNELVHETGHAVHFMAIRARPAFFWPDTTFIEAFADVPSWSVYTPPWQQRYLGRAVSRVDGLREQFAGVMLDVAWSLFELRMLRDPRQDPNALWTEITGRFLHIAPHPEISWWAVRSQLVSDPGYMIHYGLGAIITAQVRARTREAIGGFDAGNRRWYGWLSAQLLAAGGQLPTARQLQDFLGEPLAPAALIREILSMQRASH